jgi:hypothetical protein
MIVPNKNALVKDVLIGNIPHLSFHISIIRVKLVEWNNFLNLLATILLRQSSDKFIWGHKDTLNVFSSKGYAPCKSKYVALET